MKGMCKMGYFPTKFLIGLRKVFNFLKILGWGIIGLMGNFIPPKILFLFDIYPNWLFETFKTMGASSSHSKGGTFGNDVTFSFCQRTLWPGPEKKFSWFLGDGAVMNDYVKKFG